MFTLTGNRQMVGMKRRCSALVVAARPTGGGMTIGGVRNLPTLQYSIKCTDLRRILISRVIGSNLVAVYCTVQN